MIDLNDNQVRELHGLHTHKYVICGTSKDEAPFRTILKQLVYFGLVTNDDISSNRFEITQKGRDEAFARGLTDDRCTVCRDDIGFRIISPTGTHNKYLFGADFDWWPQSVKDIVKEKGFNKDSYL